MANDSGNLKVMRHNARENVASSLGNQVMKHLLLALTLIANLAQAEPLADLSAGQVGKVEFMASNPPNRWALIRGRLGPDQAITGDLLMPPQWKGSKAPAVIMSHGSDGISSTMFDVWTKELHEAGYAVFMVDSFTPRGRNMIASTTEQITWNTTVNISDAVYALKFLSTHPQIDSAHIFHLGWSRGGNAVTGAMWPSYRHAIMNTGSEAAKWAPEPKWAGSIAVYPGCTLRYRNGESKVTAPVLYLLAEKDNMTPAAPCVEEAQKLAAEGNPITYKVYAGAYHGFDRLNQSFRYSKQGTFADCTLDVRMPTGPKDVVWGPGFNRATGMSIETPDEFDALVKACGTYELIKSESNPKSRDQAIKDMLEFLRGLI